MRAGGDASASPSVGVVATGCTTAVASIFSTWMLSSGEERKALAALGLLSSALRALCAEAAAEAEERAMLKLSRTDAAATESVHAWSGTPARAAILRRRFVRTAGV